MFAGRPTAEILLILGGLGTLVGLMSAAIVSILVAFGNMRELSRKFDAVAKDTEAIKGHVNSEKTAADGREAMKDKEIAMLREQLNDEKLTRRLLAQAAVRDPAVQAAATTATAAQETLGSIESNTAAIEKNTAP